MVAASGLARAEPLRKCRKAMRLIHDWSLGSCSAPHLWKHVDHAVLDNSQDGIPDHPLLSCLHKCANSGSDQNCHRRLLKLFLDDCSFNNFLSSIDGADSSVTSVIKPSAILQILHRSDPATFSRVMGADKSRLEAFWRNLFASPEGQQYKSIHPVLRNKTVEELSSTIPITLHEDAGPYAKGKSANSLSWQPLLGSGSDLEQNFLHHTEIKRSGAPCYCFPAWRHFFKEFDYLAEGTTVEGNIVAQDGDTVWKLVLLFGKGDCEVMQSWGIPNHGDADYVCGLCKANRLISVVVRIGDRFM